MAGRNLFAEEPVATKGRNLFAEEPVRPSSYSPSGQGFTAAQRREKREGMGEELVQAIPEIVGGTIGGAMTAARGTGVGAAASGLGSAAGEAFRQIGEQVEAGTGIDLPLVKGTNAPETSTEAFTRIMAAGGRGSVGEVGARAIWKGASMALRKLQRPLAAGAKEAIEAIEPAFPELTKQELRFSPLSKAMGIERRPALLAAEATDNTLLDTIQSVAESAPFGGGKVLNAKKQISETVEGLINDLASGARGAQGRAEAGDLVLDSLDEGLTAFTELARNAYKRVDDLTAAKFVDDVINVREVSDLVVDKFGQPLTKESAKQIKRLINGVDMKPLKAKAELMLKEIEKGLGAPQSESLLRELISKPDLIPFEDAAIIRSDLIGFAANITDKIPGKAKAISKPLSKIMDSSMESAAKNLGDDALKAWRDANTLWKEGKSTFNSQFIRRMAKEDPEAIMSRIIQNPVTTLPQVRKLMSVVGNDTQVRKQLMSHFIDDAISKSIKDEVTGELNGAVLLRTLRKYGDETLKELAPKGELVKLKNFATALALNQAKQRGRNIPFIAGGFQTGGLVTMTFSDNKGSGAVMFLTPFALSRAMTNPALITLFTKGLQKELTPGIATRIASQISSKMAEEGIEAQWEETNDKKRLQGGI